MGKQGFIGLINIVILASLAIASFSIYPSKAHAYLFDYHDDYMYRSTENKSVIHRFLVNTDGTSHKVTFTDFEQGQFTGSAGDNRYFMYKLASSDYFAVTGDYYLCFNVTESITDGISRAGICQSSSTAADAIENTLNGGHILNPNDDRYYYLTKNYTGSEHQQDYIKRMNEYISSRPSLIGGVESEVDASLSFNDYDCTEGLTAGGKYSKKAYAACFFRDSNANFVITGSLFEASDSVPPTITIAAKSEWKRPELKFSLGKAVEAGSSTDINQNHFFFIAKEYPNLVIKFIDCDLVGYFFTLEDLADPASFSADSINTHAIRADMRTTIEDSLKDRWWEWFINKVYNTMDNGTLHGETASWPTGTCPPNRFLNISDEGWLNHWGAMAGTTAGTCDGPWTTSIGVMISRSFCALGDGLHKQAVRFLTWANGWLADSIGLKGRIKNF